MKKLIVIINGTGASGKDTFVKHISNEFGGVMNVSSVDQIYKIIKELGWDGKKDDKFRKMMHLIKKASVEYNDGPTKYLIEKAKEFLNSDNTILFTHIREPKEIAKFKKEAEKIVDSYTTITTLLVQIPGNKNFWNNASDNGVNGYDYDYIFDNRMSKDKGKKHSISFFNTHLLKYIKE